MRGASARRRGASALFAHGLDEVAVESDRSRRTEGAALERRQQHQPSRDARPQARIGQPARDILAHAAVDDQQVGRRLARGFRAHPPDRGSAHAVTPAVASRARRIRRFEGRTGYDAGAVCPATPASIARACPASGAFTNGRTKREDRAQAGLARDGDLAAHAFDEAARDREAEPRAGMPAGAVALDPVRTRRRCSPTRSGGMPMPVSQTEKRRRSPSAVT